MKFTKLINLKKLLVAIFISILFSSFSTYIYSKNKSGKTKVSIVLQENYNPEIYFLLRENPFLNELFESVRLQYFINNLREKNDLKLMIFYKKIDVKEINLQCKKNIPIDYIEIDKRKFIIEIADTSKNIDDINLCILSIVDFINKSINNQLSKIISEFKIYSQKNPFITIPPGIITNENLTLRYKDFLNLENKIQKNPITLEFRTEYTISKFTNTKIYFFTLFTSLLIISLVILNRKRIFLK